MICGKNTSTPPKPAIKPSTTKLRTIPSDGRIIETLGPELEILYSMDIEKIRKADFPMLGLAIEKMRSHDIVLMPGYDGEFGTVKIFTDDEEKQLQARNCFLTSRIQKRQVC